MFMERFFPFVAAPRPTLNVAAEDNAPDLSKKFRIKTLGLGFNTGYLAFNRYDQRKASFEEPPYDFEQIIQAIDTDSYVKQAFLKYKDLFWKEGWDVVGENSEAVDYLAQRLDLFEETMARPFNDFLIEVVDQLVKFANCFIVKVRGSLDPYYRINDEDSIIGYYVIPAETIKIRRDKHNKPTAYRQSLANSSPYTSQDDNEPVWPAADVIHLHLDKKPGYAFGTPFVISALDDVIALRQIEQDIQNLIHRELFPLYKYKVGTPEHPSNSQELEDAAAQLENMRVEGGLVIPERHEVEVIGAENKALEADKYLNHFKERVAVGLGVYPHHLGMSVGSTNKEATDRLDIALYDRIKKIQEYFEHAMRLYVFNEILREGGFRPLTTPMADGASDRCMMRFREIDIDTQIKRETHILAKFNANAIDWTELRSELSMPEEANPNMLHMSMQAELQIATQIEIQKATVALTPPKPVPAGQSQAPAPKKPDAIPSSTGVTPNMPNTGKDAANKMRPANQFGRRSSPNVRHSEDEVPFKLSEHLLDELVELIDVTDNEPGENDE